MARKVYKGKVKAKIIELRFATSGKLATLSKKRGDSVKKGEMIASLDKKLAQAELDKQLGDYEKRRAEFEIFNLERGEPKNDITKYLKTEKQAELNVSVKDVEIAKAKLDQMDLFSPVEGIVIDDSNLLQGIYVTPASSPVKIVDTSSYFFEIEIGQKDFPLFLDSRPMKIKLTGLNKKFEGDTKQIIPSENYKFKVEMPLPKDSNLIMGLEGEASI